MLDPKPATYTGNWFRLLQSNTSQAGWKYLEDNNSNNSLLYQIKFSNFELLHPINL